MKPWTLLGRKKIVDSPWLTVYEDRVRTGNGVVLDGYYTVEQFSVAMVLPITEDGNVVLVREYRHGCRDYVWQLPAGKINDGETAMEAAKRELLEETGYEVDSIELLGSWYISSIRMPDKQFVFLAHVHKSQAPKRDDTEEMVMREIPLTDAVRMVLNDEIKDPHSCTALLWAERKRES